MVRARVTLWGLALVAGVLFAASAAHALEQFELQALGDGHFHQLHGFDALEAYKVRKGPASAAFVVARRWTGHEAQLVVEVEEPGSFSKWAVLMLPRQRRGDDVFIYVPNFRRVLRMSPVIMRRPIFELITLDDIRPIAPGELDYTQLSDETIDGQICIGLAGHPRLSDMGFERVELAVSLETGFSLRTRYFGSKREIRRVLIAADDIRRYGERWLPSRRTVLTDPKKGVPTVVELINLLPDPMLPDRFFSKHTLRAQRFPSF